MIDKDKIKAVAFDFGGTLDSPFLHWMDIYIHLYTMKLNLPLTKRKFSRFVCVCGADDGAIATSKARTFPA